MTREQFDTYYYAMRNPDWEIADKAKERCWKEIEVIKEKCYEYALLIFAPRGESHHDANKCPYCIENLNAKS